MAAPTSSTSANAKVQDRAPGPGAVGDDQLAVDGAAQVPGGAGAAEPAAETPAGLGAEPGLGQAVQHRLALRRGGRRLGLAGLRQGDSGLLAALMQGLAQGPRGLV